MLGIIVSQLRNGAVQNSTTDMSVVAESTKGHRTPMLIIVKTGHPREASDRKPGNRGKRDSQMILMNFISRVNYNDPFSPLDYDMFRKIQVLCGVTADYFELVSIV
jgi:chitin synthase